MMMKYSCSFLCMVMATSMVYAQDVTIPQDVEASKENKIEKKDLSTISEGDNDRWHGSLMFSEKEAKWVHDAIKAYDLNIPLDILLPGMFSRDTQKKSLSNAQGLAKAALSEEKKKNEGSLPDITQDTTLYVYLNSIAYLAKDDWLLWLGSKKITPQDKDPLFTIVDVTKDRIIVLWPNFPLDKLPPSWRDDLIVMEDPSLLSNGKNVMVNTITKSLAVVLKPNQTFVGSKVDVVEGKAAPMKPEAAAPMRPPIQVNTKTSEGLAPIPSSDIEDAIEKEAEKIEKNKRLMQLKKYYQEQLSMLSNILKKK